MRKSGERVLLRDCRLSPSQRALTGSLPSGVQKPRLVMTTCDVSAMARHHEASVRATKAKRVRQGVIDTDGSSAVWNVIQRTVGVRPIEVDGGGSVPVRMA